MHEKCMKIKKYEFTYKNNGDVYDLKYKVSCFIFLVNKRWPIE